LQPPCSLKLIDAWISVGHLHSTTFTTFSPVVGVGVSAAAKTILTIAATASAIIAPTIIASALVVISNKCLHGVSNPL
jgi:hypothetical protein